MYLCGKRITMEFGFLDVLKLIGALGLFIFGMKIMSEGIQRVAGSKLRQILSAMTSNRFTGVMTGFATTAVVQSSSATTVMVVSFVNAGLLKLRESIGVIMGANIGTTVTAWLIAIFAFGKFKIAAFALPIIAIAFPLLFIKRDNLKNIAEVLIGFALLFMGLEALKDSVPDLGSNPEALAFLAEWTNLGFVTTVLFVIVGTIVTLVVQSSSAAMALTLTLLSKDIITLDIAAAMVLGENIGTTITANLAAMIANVHAKRAARAHLIFNVFGVIWMMIVFKPFLGFIEYIYEPFSQWINGMNPDLGKGESEIMLSLFHTAFNILNTLLLVWFVNFIANIVIKLVPSKGDDDLFSLDYIGSGIMGTPELSLLEAYKEVGKFGGITARMNGFVTDLLETTEGKKRQPLIEQVTKYEDMTDNFEVEITKYLTDLSAEEMSPKTSQRVRNLLSITDDLEKIGDLFYQITMNLESKLQRKVYFVPKQRQNLKAMFKLVDDALEVMTFNLNQSADKLDLQKASELENEINELRNTLRTKHLKDVEKSAYSFESGMVYNDVFIALEKIGDHIYSISAAIDGKV